MKNSIRFIIYIASAGVIPFFIAWAYLYFSRVGNWDTGSLDWAALGLCLLVGFGCISALPLEKGARVFSFLLYAPIMFIALVYFSLSYVCFKFSVDYYFSASAACLRLSYKPANGVTLNP